MSDIGHHELNGLPIGRMEGEAIQALIAENHDLGRKLEAWKKFGKASYTYSIHSHIGACDKGCPAGRAVDEARAELRTLGEL